MQDGVTTLQVKMMGGFHYRSKWKLSLKMGGVQARCQGVGEYEVQKGSLAPHFKPLAHICLSWITVSPLQSFPSNLRHKVEWETILRWVHTSLNAKLVCMVQQNTYEKSKFGKTRETVPCLIQYIPWIKRGNISGKHRYISILKVGHVRMVRHIE